MGEATLISPTYSFAFVCHHNSLLIYGSMRTPTLDRFDKVTHMSTALSMVACLLMAIPAYLVFTNKTQGNILNNFSQVSFTIIPYQSVLLMIMMQSDTLINVARFCFGLNMFTTLPLELFVCREVRILLSFNTCFLNSCHEPTGHRTVFLLP